MSKSLFLKEATRAKWADRSFHLFERKSDSLFLRVGFAPFLREDWKLDLFISQFLDLLLLKTKQKVNRSSSLFLTLLKRVKIEIFSFKTSERAIRFFGKNYWFARETKVGIPNPDKHEKQYLITPSLYSCTIFLKLKHFKEMFQHFTGYFYPFY